MEYVAAKSENFTTIQAHYIATAVDFEIDAMATSEYQACDAVKKQAAEKLNNREEAKDAEDQVEYTSWNLEVEVISRKNYLESELRKIAQATAAEEARITARQKADEALENLKAEAAKELVGLKHWNVDYNGQILVSRVERFNSYTHKYETIYRERKFRRGAKGTINWAKIREAAQEVCNWHIAQELSQNNIESRKAASRKLLAEIKEQNLPTDGLCVTDSGELRYTASIANVQQYARLASQQ